MIFIVTHTQYFMMINFTQVIDTFKEVNCKKFYFILFSQLV